MNEKFKFKVDASDIRLDVFLSEKLSEFSRTSIQYSIKSNFIKVNGKSAKSSTKLNIDDIVECDIKKKEINNIIVPQDIPLDILYEDSDIIVINKPSGLVVHPGHGNKDNTLVNGLVFHCEKLSKLNEFRPGIVHRLDKDTSGVIVIAKNDKSHANIAEQFMNRQVVKTYYALVWGEMDDKGVIEGLITRDSFDRKKFKMSVSNGKPSKTEYLLEGYFPPISLLKLKPETGRTHQIRVHLNSLGHPIFSDNQYSGGKKKIKSYHVKYIQILKRLFKLMDRVALHAYEIKFTHPTSNREVAFSAPFPNDFNRSLELLKSE